MARTISTVMALVALLALSACNNVTGPATGSTRGEIGGGGDHGPDTFDGPDTITPGEEGGGGGSGNHPLNRIRLGRRDRQREEVAPVEGEGGGGSDEAVRPPVETERRQARGKDRVTPGD